MPRIQTVGLAWIILTLDRFERLTHKNLCGYIRGGNTMLFPGVHVAAHDALTQAANYVQAVEERQGMMIASIEEIAYRMGYIPASQLAQLAGAMASSSYGQDLLRLLEDD